MHDSVFGMYPVIVNPTKNHVSLLVKCQKENSFTRAFTGVNFRPNFDKRSGVMMPGSRKLSKVGAEGGGPPPDQGRSRFQGFIFKGWGGGGIEGVRTPSPKPWSVHGNYTKDFQNERKMRWRDT